MYRAGVHIWTFSVIRRFLLMYSRYTISHNTNKHLRNTYVNLDLLVAFILFCMF